MKMRRRLVAPPRGAACEPRHAVAELLDRLAEIEVLATNIENDELVTAAIDVLDAISTALASSDHAWFARLRPSPRVYADSASRRELELLAREHEQRQERWRAAGRNVTARPPMTSRPVRRQEDEGEHVAGVTREALTLATQMGERDAETVARFVEPFIHIALGRCVSIWTLLPDENGDRARRKIAPAARERATIAVAGRLRDVIRQDRWPTDATAHDLARIYLREVGLTAKAVSNIFR